MKPPQHERSQKLIALCKGITEELLKEEIEKRPVQKVLFEQRSHGMWCGHTASFIEVRVPCERDLHGVFAEVRLEKCEDEHIIGKVF